MTLKVGDVGSSRDVFSVNTETRDHTLNLT